MSYPPTSPPPEYVSPRPAPRPPFQHESSSSSHLQASERLDDEYLAFHAVSTDQLVSPPRSSFADSRYGAHAHESDMLRSSSRSYGLNSSQGSRAAYEPECPGRESFSHSDSMNWDTQSQRGFAMASSHGHGSPNEYREKGMEEFDGVVEGGKRIRPISRGLGGRQAAAGGGSPAGGSWWKRMSGKGKALVVVGIIVAVLVVAGGVAAGVVVNNNAREKASLAAAAATFSWKTAASGGDGSTVYMEDGTSFIYNNSFGGFWNAVPFNNSAQPQSDIPALSTTWDYNEYKINGVNLGGWLVVEPFIVPSLFEPFNPSGGAVNTSATVIDEYTLSVALGSNLSAVLEEHYSTFVTEKDFAEIAGAGLNWVRIPIPYWAIETYAGEPFLANVAWTYFLKAIAWARKYGLRVNLDLHAVPGSQNGYNHSSKQGTINLLNGVMGIANAQRTLNYIRTLTEFISQPEYSPVIPMFSVLNEPFAQTIGVQTLRQFYLETYNTVRDITGIGAGNGPFIAFHDGFLAQGVSLEAGGWNTFLSGSDRVSLDIHPYFVFQDPSTVPSEWVDLIAQPALSWAHTYNISTATTGLTIAGEWSLAINDCGQWLNNVGNGNRYEGTYYAIGNTTAPAFEGIGSCANWTNYASWGTSTKNGFRGLALVSMETFGNWFFWNWKTGYSNSLGMINTPMWNYQLGLAEGYVPTNPRATSGAISSALAAATATITTYPAPTLSAWMTGGTGAGTINATQLSQFGVWPPTALGTTPTSFLPTYTPTGAVITMSASTPTSYPAGFSSTATPGDGWYNPSDTSLWNTPVAGCTYPDPWSGVGAAVPTTVCTGGAVAARATRFRREHIPRPTHTPPPVRRA